ncbi:MAG: MotA/TolQ/ExbB proton channel family protein [Gammaproteobacteria bacterium]|nr:MotA/TolQ/ExbB proton channel family protein [Gammaproteobacteria bacterium]MDH5727891.1 MotA/TolQ/ExbB proton channel family protein [Gammaproteobacteria bacterium]
MFDSFLYQALHQVVSVLLYPVVAILFVVVCVALMDLGMSVGEFFSGLKKLQTSSIPHIESLARKRIERADLVTRTGPMLGLMGTLIPLGPGLAGLGQGDVKVLADAVTIAFDTTVIGLLAGAIGFVISRLRRRWYDDLLNHMERS